MAKIDKRITGKPMIMDKPPRTECSPQERLFVFEYLADPRKNAAEAVRKAGYKASNAYWQANKLLKTDRVVALINEFQMKLENTLHVDAQRVVEEFAAIAFADIRDTVEIRKDGSIRIKTFEEMPEKASRAIAAVRERKRTILGPDGEPQATEVELEYKFHDKKGALDSLAKHLGMFIDLSRSEHHHFKHNALDQRSLGLLDAEELEWLARISEKLARSEEVIPIGGTGDCLPRLEHLN